LRAPADACQLDVVCARMR